MARSFNNKRDVWMGRRLSAQHGSDLKTAQEVITKAVAGLPVTFNTRESGGMTLVTGKELRELRQEAAQGTTLQRVVDNNAVIAALHRGLPEGADSRTEVRGSRITQLGNRYKGHIALGLSGARIQNEAEQIQRLLARISGLEPAAINLHLSLGSFQWDPGVDKATIPSGGVPQIAITALQSAIEDTGLRSLKHLTLEPVSYSTAFTSDSQTLYSGTGITSPVLQNELSVAVQPEDSERHQQPLAG